MVGEPLEFGFCQLTVIVFYTAFSTVVGMAGVSGGCAAGRDTVGLYSE